MTETTESGTAQIFDPEVPERVAEFLRAHQAWRAGHGTWLREHIGSFPDPDRPEDPEARCELTVSDLQQLLERAADAEKRAEVLAGACAAYRARAEEAESVARVLASALRITGRTDRDVAAILRSIGMYGPLPRYVGGHGPHTPAAATDGPGPEQEVAQ